MYFIMILAAKGGGGVTNHRPPNLSFEKFRIFFSGGDFSWEGGGNPPHNNYKNLQEATLYRFKG